MFWFPNDLTAEELYSHFHYFCTNQNESEIFSRSHSAVDRNLLQVHNTCTYYVLISKILKTWFGWHEKIKIVCYG